MERVRRKKDFTHMERVDGRMVNVLQGLELHTGVFSPAEQHRIVACVHHLQEHGCRGLLRERTYSEPRKWMRGKGRATIQFGCCYNYATDRQGNPPGIIRGEQADPLPPMLRAMVRRLVEWRVLPSSSCVPDSCIVNVYDVDDCIPPHIDHHDFLRSSCTVSFLAECSILFGRNIRVLGPREFAGAASISLPIGSVLVLNGNGAGVAKHCVSCSSQKDLHHVPEDGPQKAAIQLHARPRGAAYCASSGQRSTGRAATATGGKSARHWCCGRKRRVQPLLR